MPDITKVIDRNKLKARREPYWRPIERGNFIGFRKATATSEGTWLARSRDAGTGKQRTKSLGALDHLPPSDRYGAAAAAAAEWFKHLGAGGSQDALTVRGACEAYVQHLHDNGRALTGKDAEGRFKRWVYPQAKLSSTELQKLKAQQLSSWRTLLLKTPAVLNPHAPVDRQVAKPRTKSSVNRDMTAMRAALNLALGAGAVVSDMAWREALRPFEKADGRRTVYLSREERKRFIAACPPEFARFVTLLAFLPFRPGAVAKLSVGDFDPAQEVVTISKDKTPGGRQIRLPPAIAKLFSQLSQERTAASPLVAQANGRPWTKDTWKKPMKQFALAAGLPEKTVAYSLRHSAITDLVSGGLDLASVAAISGTSVAMIERHYKHLQQERVMKALEGLVL